ncbi:MAG: hypothetical protein WD314_04275 [Trueperaceae bacterium]
MKIKVRRIGNSRGIVLPWLVVELLGSAELDLTLIGRTAVLTSHPADELELQAALAFAGVKAGRRNLFEQLALNRDE